MYNKISEKSQIRIGALLSYAAVIVNVLSGLLLTPWIIVQIGENGYGIYTLVNSIVSLFLFDFGLSTTTARYISKYRAEGAQQKITTFLGAVYKLYILIDVLILLAFTVLYFFLDSIYANLSPADLADFKTAYIIVAGFSVLSFPFSPQPGILNAYEKFIQLKAIDIFQKIIYIIANVIALSRGLGLQALVSVNAVSGIISIAIKWLFIRFFTDAKAGLKNIDRGIYKKIFHFSVWVMLSSIASRLIFNITPTVLATQINGIAAGMFGIVATIEGYTFTFSGAINGMFMPKISKFDHEQNNEHLMDLLLKVGRFQFGLGGLIVVGFYAVGSSFLKLWLEDNSYSTVDLSYIYCGILLIILPGIFYNCLQIAHTTMTVRKKVHIQSAVNICTGLLSITLVIILTMKFGFIGACAAISIAYASRALALHIIYHKTLRLNMFYFAKKCYLRMGGATVLALITAYFINRIFTNLSWSAIILKSGIITVVYFVLLLFVGLDSQTRRNAIRKIHKSNK